MLNYLGVLGLVLKIIVGKVQLMQIDNATYVPWEWDAALQLVVCQIQ